MTFTTGAGLFTSAAPSHGVAKRTAQIHIVRRPARKTLSSFMSVVWFGETGAACGPDRSPLLHGVRRFVGILSSGRIGDWRQDAIEFELAGIDVCVHASGRNRQLERPEHALHDEAAI